MAELDIMLVDSSYELVRKLASSGQADVYQARLRVETPENRNFEFAFKVYKQAAQAGPAMENELAILHQLEDCQVPGVPRPIPPQDYLPKKGARFPLGKKQTGLLTKFAKGEDLARLLEAKTVKSGFKPWQVADWVKKLCEILGKVHEQDIVHGDLKPGNILWDAKNDVIWLIDFGSAVFLRGAQCPPSHTAAYASPQCMAGEPPRKTDDVYSLGVTIFELLAGKHEFPVSLDWNLPISELEKQLKPRLEKLEVAAEFMKRGLFEGGDADLCQRFAGVVQKCLHPNPDERFQSLNKLVDALGIPCPTRTFWFKPLAPVADPVPPSAAAAEAPGTAPASRAGVVRPPPPIDTVTLAGPPSPLGWKRRGLALAGIAVVMVVAAAAGWTTIHLRAPRPRPLAAKAPAVPETKPPVHPGVPSNEPPATPPKIPVTTPGSAPSTVPIVAVVPPAAKPEVKPPSLPSSLPRDPSVQLPTSTPKIAEPTPGSATPTVPTVAVVPPSVRPEVKTPSLPPSPPPGPIVPTDKPPQAVAFASPAKVPAPSPAPSPFNRAAPRFTNSLGMVFVPAGNVWFCIWQTRAGDFKQYQQATKAEVNGRLAALLNEQQDLPVREVTWEQAQSFCSWLTKKDREAGLLPRAGTRYRLPRDSEWSAAARLGSEPGQTPEERMAGLNLSLDPNKMNDHFHPVSVAGGGQGLCHLGDNGAEWCEDTYADYPRTKTFRTSTVIGEAEPKARYRGKKDITAGEEWLGFRCVLDPGANDNALAAGGISSPEQIMLK